MSVNSIEQFKNFRMSREELSNKFDGDLLAAKIENPVIVYNTDVVNALSAFKNDRITLAQLLDWVNTIWFTELFDYDDEYSNSIASVLNKLEDLDEEGRELTQYDMNKYIDALLENREI